MYYHIIYAKVGITIAAINTKIIIEDIVFLVFLLFILNIVTPFCLNVQTTQIKQNTKRILYMNFYYLASLIIFCLVIYRAMKKDTRAGQKNNDQFWDRENQSNSVRKKSLDNLNYITIPFENLPTHIMTEDANIKEYLDTLQILSTQKIVNFTGYSNTDLKLEYGTANLNFLSEYDQNYTLLVLTLQKWGEVLYNAGLQDDAATIFEFAVEISTDIGKTYYTLAQIYADRGETNKISHLVEIAETLNSTSQQIIVRTLQKSYPYIG